MVEEEDIASADLVAIGKVSLEGRTFVYSELSLLLGIDRKI